MLFKKIVWRQLKWMENVYEYQIVTQNVILIRLLQRVMIQKKDDEGMLPSAFDKRDNFGRRKRKTLRGKNDWLIEK